MKPANNQTTKLRIEEAAKVLKVSTKTLRRWEEKGLINSYRTQGGHRRYDIKELQRIKSKSKRKEKLHSTPVYSTPIERPLLTSVTPVSRVSPIVVTAEPQFEAKITAPVETHQTRAVVIPEARPLQVREAKATNYWHPVPEEYLINSIPEEVKNVQVSPENVQVINHIPHDIFNINPDEFFAKQDAIEEDIVEDKVLPVILPVLKEESYDKYELPKAKEHKRQIKKVTTRKAKKAYSQFMLLAGLVLIVSSLARQETYRQRISAIVEQGITNSADKIASIVSNKNDKAVKEQSVLAEADSQIAQSLNVNIESIFNADLTVNADVTVDGNTTIEEDLALNGGDLTSTATTFNLFDTTTTNLNIGGVATAVSIAAETGTTTINNSLTVDDNLEVGGNIATIGTGTPASVDSTGGDLFVTNDLEIDGVAYIPTLSINGESFTDLTGTGLTISGGTLQASLGTSITSGEIDDDTIKEVDLNVSNTAVNGYALTYNSTTSGFTWTDLSTTSVFTDGGTVSYLTTTTDAVVIGGTTELAKFAVDGDTDEIQLLVQGNSTQTANPFVIENSSGTDLFTVNSSGQITSGSSAITLTTTDGYLDADAVQLLSSGTGSTSSASGLQVTSDRIGLLQGCANSEILKWNEGSSLWECATDTGGASAIINVESNDVAVGSSVDTIDFTSDFSLTASPSNEVNFSIADDILDFTEFQDTLDLDTSLTLNQSTSTWTQNFSGTTGTGLTYNAASLTTGQALSLVATNTAITDTAINPISFTLTNAQATTANTTSYTGLSLSYTHNPSVATATETLGLLSIASNTSSPTDTTVASILRLENLDTATGNSITATNGLLIESSTGGLITDAIDVSDADLTNAINFGANFVIFDGVRVFEGTTGTITFEDTAGNDLITIADSGTAGDLTVTGTSTLTGNVDATAGLDVTGSSLTVGGANFSVAPGTGNITTAGDLALNGGDLTSSSTLNITPSGAFVAGATGQTTTLQGSVTALTSTGVGNDITLTAADDILLDDAQLTTAVPVSLADAALNAALTQGLVDAINDVYDAATGGSGSVWSRNSGTGLVYPTTTTDNVVIGGSTGLAKFAVDGDTDEIQALIQGNSTQTSSLFVAETSAGTDQLTLSNAGALAIEGAISDISGTIFEINDDLQVTGNDIADSSATTRITLGATTTLTNTTLALSGTATVSTDQTSLDLFNATTTTINFAAAATTLNIADAATTKTIDIGGVGASGTDTINIATNSTAADTLTIGNSNSSTLVSITGGDDWSITNTGVMTLSASAAQTTALVITDTDYTNALSIGDNIITGTTFSLVGTDAAIDFNDFDVSTDGILSFNSDTAGDQITVTSPAGDHQTLVVDATTNANTSTAGIIDLNIGAGDAAVEGIDISLTQNNGATAGRDAIGQRITLTANDADGDLFGILLTGAATANAAAGSYEAAISIDNAEDTAASMTDAILITSSGVSNGVTDAIDVSAANLNNAINLGANFALFDGIRLFEGTTGTLTFEDTSGNDLATITDNGTTGTVTSNILNLTADSNQIVLDSNGNTGILTWSPSATRTITFPDTTGTVCLTTGNCAGSGTGVTTAGGSTNTLAKFTASQAIGDSSITDTGSLVTFSTDVDITTAASENLVLTNTSASTDQLSLAVSGVTTDGVDGLAIAFTQADDLDATDTNSAIAVALTSSSTDADTFYGLNFTDITAGSATETAVHIGGGFDNVFEIEGTAGDGFQTFIQVTAPSADRTITIPNAAGEICLSSGNCAGGSGGSKWTDSGTVVYLTDTTDELVVGGSSALSSAKVSLDGDADQIQLIVQGHSTQTSSLFVAETSAGADQLTLSNAGALAIEGAISDITDATLNIDDDVQITGNDILDSGSTSRITLGATTTLTNTTTTLSGTTTLTASSLANITSAATLTFSGDIAISGGDITGANSASIDIGEATSGAITFAAGSTGDFVFSIDDDSTIDATGTITNTGQIADINITLGDDAAVDTVSGLNIDATSAATGDADTLIGINIADLASANATVLERALQIGSGWDANIFLNDTSSSIQIADGGVITFEDSGGNDLMTITDGGTTGSVNITGDLTVGGTTVSSPTVNVFNCNDCIDWDDITDTTSLDADTSIAAGAGEELTYNKTFTDATSENGLVANFTASDSTSGTTAQLGFVLTNVASTEGLDAILVIDNADADDSVGDAIRITSAAGTILTGLDFDDTDIVTDIELQNGETIDNNTDGTITLTSTTLSFSGTTITASSATALNCSDCVNFDDLSDSLSLDAATTITNATGSDLTLDLTSTGDFVIADAGVAYFTFTDGGALTQAGSGQVTFTGNVDATAGLDVTTSNLTVGGANFSVAPGTGNITTAGDLALNGGDLTSSAGLNITPGGAFVAGVTGQTTTLQGSTLALTSTGAGNDITLTAADDILLDDAQLTSAVPVSLADTALNASLTQGVVDAINDVYDMASGGSGGVWTLNTGLIYPTTSTDNVTIGGTTNLGKLSVNGDTDEVQFLVQGHSTQTNSLIVAENSSGTDRLTLDNSGNLAIEGTISDISDATLTVDDDLQVNGNDIADSGGTSRITLGSTSTLTNSTLVLSGTSTLTASSLTAFNCSDCIDFDDLEDTLDVDAALTLNQSTNTWTQNFTGTTTTGLTYNANSLTTGEALEINGVWAPTGGSAQRGIDINFTNNSSTLANQLYAVDIDLGDGTALANTLRGTTMSVSSSGNAAKNLTGAYYNISTSSTTADNLVGIETDTAVSGIITSGTREVIGVLSEPSAGAESTGGVTNVTGFRSAITADVGAGGTVTGYGMYIANGVFDTDGTSTQYGLYVESPTGADANYAAVFAGGNVGIGDTSPSAPLEVGDGTDSIQISSVGDITFVDANGAASITGPAGGALTIAAGASQALTLTANAASSWTTSSGALTLTSAAAATWGTAAGDLTLDSGDEIVLADTDTIIIGGHAGNVNYNVISDAGGAPGSASVDSDDDLYVEGFVEIDGGLQVDATLTATDLSCTDCLDFAEFIDSMTVDAATDINVGTNLLSVDLDSTGTFEIRDGATTFVAFDDDSTVDITFPAAGTLGIDAATTDNTTTGGVIDVNIDTVTTGNIGLNIDHIIRDSAGITSYGARINETIDTDAAESSTGYGLYIAADNDDASSTIYGLLVDADADSGAEGTEYAAAFLDGNVGVGTSTPSLARLQVQGAGGSSIALQVLGGSSQSDDFLRITDSTGVLEYFSIDPSVGAIFNEVGSASVDFRIEGDTNANLLFADASADRIGIGDATPDAFFDFDFASTSTTAGTEYGAFLTTADTGVVTTGTDTTYGSYNQTTRTGATGGTLNTYGQYINLTTDNAGAGTHTAYGLYVALDGNADTNYAGILTGGNVGIGTSTPQRLLDVSTTGTGIQSSFEVSNLQAAAADVGAGIAFAGTGDAAIGRIAAALDAASTANSYMVFNTYGSSVIQEVMRLTSGANVGVGTTAPDARVEINHATGDNLRLTYNDANGSAAAYTDFSLASDGDLTIDSAGGAVNLAADDDFLTLGDITATLGAAELLTIDAAATDTTTTGGVIDLNVDAGNAAVLGLNIDFSQSDGATAATDAIAQNIVLTANDADGDVFGTLITSAATVNAAAGSYESLLKLVNAENTIGAVTDAILIDSTSATDTDITDAIDASDTNIVNALNIGANYILGDGIRQFSSSSTVWTVEDTSGNDLLTITDNGTDGNVNVTGDLAITGGNITTALTADSTLTVTSTLTANGNTVIGNANTDTLTINAGSSGTGITLADASFTTCTALETVAGVLTCGSDAGGTTPDFDAIYAQSITNTNLTMEIDDTTGLTYNMNTTGAFNIQDNGTTYFSFDDDSTVDITFPAAGTLGIDAATTANTTTGGVVDLNVNAGNAAVLGLNIDFTQNDGATAATDAIAANIALSANDADGDVFGLSITGSATANAAAGSYEALLRLINAENTIGAVTDAILIDSTSATDTDITDAIDASDTNIVNALNVGANNITGTAFSILATSTTLTVDAASSVQIDGDTSIILQDAGATYATFTQSGTTDLQVDVAGNNFILADGDLLNVGGIGAATYNAFAASGEAADNVDVAADNDLYIGGDLEVDGSTVDFSAAALTVSDITCTDCLDFTELADSLSVDAATDINLGANLLSIDLDSTGTFEIRDGATTFVAFDDDSTVDVTFPAVGTLGIDAATTDNTTTAGVIDLNVDTVTNLNSGLNISHIIRDSAGINGYAALITETIDTDAAQSSTGYGLYINADNDDVSSTITGLFVDADSDGGGEGTEYAAVFVDGNVGIGDISPSSALEIGDGVDSIQFSSVGDITFVDADGAASFTGPAGGALTVAAGASQALTLTANAASSWTTSAGALTLTSAAAATWGTSAGDLTLNSGDEIVLSDTDTIIIGGHAGNVAYNVISDAGGAPGSGSVDTDDDLYVEGFVEIDGGLQVDATVTATDFSCTDCLDFAELIDSMTVDAATDINLGANALTIDMDSTGDFSVRDGVTDIATFSDTGAIAFAPTSGTNFSVTAAGAGTVGVTTATGAQTFTSSVVTGTTTTSAFVFDATALTTGTGAYITSDSITTGTLVQIATTGNTFTDGTLFDLSSTSTALTGSTSEGSLVDLDWTPGSTTNATGDLFRLSLGANGNLTGKIFDIEDGGSSVFSVGEAQITSAIPHQFTAAGDVSVAYDIQLTNQTASYIKSNAPLQVESGETFESNNLTLKTYNSGRIIADTRSLGVGTSNGRGLLEVDSTQTSTFGKALAIFNHDESQDLITASASGTTEFAIASDGTMYLGTNATTATTTALCWASTTRNGATVYQVGDCNGTPTDLAENFATDDASIEAGDVVAITGQAQEVMPKGLITSKAYVKKTTQAYEDTVIGVVSTQPNQTYGDDELFEESENPRPVSLAGRVPVKVTTQNGNIKAGDPLTASSIPGVAMKATQKGYIIGRALQDYENQDTQAVGKIITFVNLAWFDPGITAELAGNEASQSAQLQEAITSLDQRLDTQESYFEASESGAILTVAKANLNELNVLGDVTLGDTLINGKLNVGALVFDNIENSINAIGTLKIQDLALGNIEIMGGLVTIDTNGNVVVNEITADKYNVAGASAGVATLPQGEKTIVIETDQVQENSLIFVTANTSINTPLSVTAKVTGESFTVEITEIENQDVEFNWWIVDHE